MVFIRNKTSYVSKTLQNILQLDEIYNFLFAAITPDFVDQQELHDFWEMVYIESGEAILTSNDDRIPATEGTLCFHKPGEVHAIESANGSVVRAYFVTFSSSSEIVKLFDSLSITLRHEQRGILSKLLEEAQKIYNNRPDPPDNTYFYTQSLKSNCPTGAQQLFRMHVEEFLISVIQLAEEKEKVIYYESKEELDALIYKKLIEKIKNSVYSSLSIPKLCDELGYGRTYLSILFKKNTGESIMNYYNRLKVNEAKKLIKEGKHPLSEIAEMLNFSTRYYFSRVFKRVVGITPTEYKANL